MNEQYDKVNIVFLSVLAYVGPLFLIGKFAYEKNSDLVHFHCNQGMRLFIFEVISSALIFALYIALSSFQAAKEIVPLILSVMLSVVSFIFFIMGICSAIKKEKIALPFIGGKKVK